MRNWFEALMSRKDGHIDPSVSVSRTRCAGAAITRRIQWAPRRAVGRLHLRRLAPARLYSLGHVGNDAQKTIGVIAVLRHARSKRYGSLHIPVWIVARCRAAPAPDMPSGGGRIVHIMGCKFTRLTIHNVLCNATARAHG